ncbi:MAG: extracellular solute-binding protein, partial [Actinobacteria bacterium]|nr:extracellular solute-binding protein [Actinomycetota bacterium]NIS30822.1 extracellular solute-binding protein [Actinomycetota bacterium]NIT96960.1 extracellular solute-binding protein [Actinomycetota bacterium]NIU18992.1 extracellular solute-binding protein [Actinomycetota bacterium]NIU66014.1 extracellular solute-binding protein [Actinomycetota bacterium]
MTRRIPLLALLVSVVLVAAACGDGGDEQSITVYSGRDEQLIRPLLDAFTEATGIEVEARWGESAELALLIQTEGGDSPADVFISQSPGALGL